MTMNELERLKAIRERLIKLCQHWALGWKFDAGEAQDLREEAALILHHHYLQNIPLYRKLAQQEGVSRDADIETIKRKLVLTDGIFKSYDQAWLDEGDFDAMNRWLSNVYHRCIDIDVTGINSLDDWLAGLRKNGIITACSSGTSGLLSLIPREQAEWELAKKVNTCYLAPLLMRRRIIKPRAGFLLETAVRMLSPDRFAAVAGRIPLPALDAFFLGFRAGGTGNQMLIQELVHLSRRHHYLYDTELGPAVIRCLRRGARTERERWLLRDFQSKVVTQAEQKYMRLIEIMEASAKAGHKVFIFGAPYQFKELCDMMSGCNRKISLPPGSFVLFGGGWKSFNGEALKREELVDMLSGSFGLSPSMILEGYSMTETSILTMRCPYGRFHLPPIVEPIIYDDALNPVANRNTAGTFGFLDILSASRPGFIISGDRVDMADGECACGLCGPAITGISRAGNREVKGCGGIMSSIAA